MSKENAVIDKIKEEPRSNNVAKKVDYKAKWDQTREVLVTQLKDHLEKSEFHKNMATKAQGVIEVNDQFFLEEDLSES